jgi:hypothetical protein
MSVAIAIPQLQLLSDVNVSLGVGVDEYALTYDHDTANFVLRAPVVAPDLSGYALLSGRAGGQTLYGGTAANDDITIHGTINATRTTSYVILQPTAGYVGINTASPVAALDVSDSPLGINVGADSTATTRTNATAKSGKLTIPHYLTAEENASVMIMTSNSGYNTLSLGGGSSASNAATYILFYTAANGTTVTGTERLRIDNQGFVGIGATAPATRLDIAAGALTMKEMSAPTGVADKAMLYTKDNGSGKTQLCCKLGDDVEIVMFTQA